MHTVSLIIHGAAQVVTCASPNGAKRGAALADVGIVPDGAVAIDGERILAVGSSADILRDYHAEHTLDAAGKVVCPGFVDAHTHIVYGGHRLNEFEMRIGGVSYMDIMAAGGGIASTMRATRAAPFEVLLQEAGERLEEMVRLGTTTIEIKSGYGLDTATELKMLAVIEALQRQSPADIVPTFLGAHAIPPEYAGRADEYTALVIEEMLSAAGAWYRGSVFATSGRPLHADVFCEKNAFTTDQTRRILQAAREQGMAVKAHVDEFTALGGLTAALECGALSVDHLDVTAGAEITALAKSAAVGVVLPAVNFNLGSTHYANARAFIEAGAAVALATDLNPGSAPCPSMPLVMAMACRYQRLLPAEALNAATLNAAYALGMGADIGSLEAGKQADLLVLDMNDYRQLMYQFGGNPVRHVLKRGRIIL
jgi:imidazolonepropionase